MFNSDLSMPWASAGDRQYSTPGSLLLKVRLGEAPQAAPALMDVNQHVLPPARKLDGGPIDRIVGSLAGAVRAARLHPSAANAAIRGSRHCCYDELEEAVGLSRTFVLRVAPGTPIGKLCEKLSQISTVESVSPNYVCATPFDLEPGVVDPQSDRAFHAWAMVGAAEALAYEPGDPSVMVGLIDSGIVEDHEELKDAFRAGSDTVRLKSHDVAPGVSLIDDHDLQDDDPTDRVVGHGMGCAGIIAAAGVGMPAGLGGAARIIPMRALGAAKLPDKEAPVGVGAIADLDLAMKLAVDLGAKVINMSFGTDDRALHPSSPRPHRDIVEYALARGCVLVAASGNNGEETKYWPAAYSGVIAVGAVDDDGRPTHFTTRGDHVALCAPGERVVTTSLAGYQYATGTSFAAPFVTAAASLLVSRAARRAAPISGAMARDILIRSARPFADDHPDGCGAGVLDAAAALSLLDAEIDQAVGSRGGDYAM